MKLKISGCSILLILLFSITRAQATINDSIITGKVQVVNKDYRIELLGKKMAEFNESLKTRGGFKMEKGYRLMLLSTSDRNQAMTIRSKMLQQYPDQKVYMTFQSPYIKLKFGNFVEKSEAEKYRKQVAAMGIIQNNIYLVSEMVEVKVDKNAIIEE